jgi:hypothetical protein
MRKIPLWTVFLKILRKPYNAKDPSARQTFPERKEYVCPSETQNPSFTRLNGYTTTQKRRNSQNSRRISQRSRTTAPSCLALPLQQQRCDSSLYLCYALQNPSSQWPICKKKRWEGQYPAEEHGEPLEHSNLRICEASAVGHGRRGSPCQTARELPQAEQPRRHRPSCWEFPARARRNWEARYERWMECVEEEP